MIPSLKALVGQTQILLCQPCEIGSSAALQPANDVAGSIKATLYG